MPNLPENLEGRGAFDGLVSVVIPTLREAGNLRQLVEQLSRVMRQAGRPVEILIVDDDSRDGTQEIVRQLAEEGLPVRLITRVGQRGLGTAVLLGFSQAKGGILACMDGDLSHPPEALPRMLACLDDPAVEFVIGSRHVPGAGIDEQWSWLRRLNSRVAAFLARPLTRVRDPMSGYFALPRSVLARAAELNPIGYKIGLELLVKCGCLNVREVPIRFQLRHLGHSKLNPREHVNFIRHLANLAVFKYVRAPRGRVTGAKCGSGREG